MPGPVKPYITSSRPAPPSSPIARDEMALSERAIGHALLGRGGRFTDEQMDAILRSPAGQPIKEMGTYAAVGTPDEVAATVERFTRHADADELMISLRSPTPEGRLRSAELLTPSPLRASA